MYLLLSILAFGSLNTKVASVLTKSIFFHFNFYFYGVQMGVQTGVQMGVQMGGPGFVLALPWVHLQFANLLEKQTSKNIFFIHPGKYYLPIWKDETTPLKLHAQLTYKKNEKQYYKHTFVVLLSCVVVLLHVWKAR